MENLRKFLPFIITSLEQEVSECHDAQALELTTFIKSYKVVATLLMVADILSLLANLSRAFQWKQLDYTLIKPLVFGIKATLQNLKLTPGHHFTNMNHLLTTDLEPFAIHAPAVDTFKMSIHDKYLDVKSHLERRFPNVELLEAFSILMERIGERVSVVSLWSRTSDNSWKPPKHLGRS